jgi:hypothetical protein
MNSCYVNNSLHYKPNTVLNIDQINLEGANGTCRLTSVINNAVFRMIWSIENYPMHVPSMPGSPFPILVNFNIYQYDCHPTSDKSLKGIKGSFVFEQASGTFPNNCPLGFPYGIYYALGRNHKSCCDAGVLFSLNEGNMEIILE